MNEICKNCEWADPSNWSDFICDKCHAGSEFVKRVTFSMPKPLTEAQFTELKRGKNES
jgi:hypothetical protein